MEDEIVPFLKHEKVRHRCNRSLSAPLSSTSCLKGPCTSVSVSTDVCVCLNVFVYIQMCVCVCLSCVCHPPSSLSGDCEYG